MKEQAELLLEQLPRPRQALVVPQLALRTVTARDGSGVYASSDRLYKGAVFGRDSLEVAEDLIETRPRLVRTILTTMARLQGRESNDVTEEEPGKIVHEYRTSRLNGRPLPPNLRAIYEQLASKWGGDEKELAYYGSIDATPHFLRTLGRYSLRYGDGLLETTVSHRSGEAVTVRTAAQLAASWLVDKIAESGSGLLEYQRRNPHGILNQVWKDSDEFYVHANGEPVNHERPIASVEVQGLAYDALLAAAQFFPERAEEYERLAQALRERTISLLWQAERSYFSLGTDYDPESEQLRVISTLTANPAALLDTGFFDRLTTAERRTYITGIVETIMGTDFLTKAGVRSRALSAADTVEIWDYHGSYVSWPKETYDIAKGLRRQGFGQLARQLENRLLNVVLRNREYPEFVYVDESGRVLNSSPSKHSHGELTIVEGPNVPERIQAWTVSAVMAIVAERFNKKLRRGVSSGLQTAWAAKLEKTILDEIPHVDRYINPISLLNAYPGRRYQLARA